MQGREVDAVHLLVLVEAGKDDGLGAGRSIPLQLQASRQISFIMHCIGELIEAIARCPGPN